MKKLLYFTFLFFIFIFTNPAHAQTYGCYNSSTAHWDDISYEEANCNNACNTGIGYTCRQRSGSDSPSAVTLANPLTGNTRPTDVNILIGQIINAVLGLVGSIALAMFIYGGIVWMTAAGNKEGVQKGKDILIWSTLGIVVIFCSYAIVRFVLAQALNVAGTGS
jgi:hypothetical protein